MRRLLHVAGVSLAIILMSSIDAISALLLSNPYTAFLLQFFLWFFLAFIAAMFIYPTKQILNKLEKGNK